MAGRDHITAGMVGSLRLSGRILTCVMDQRLLSRCKNGWHQTPPLLLLTGAVPVWQPNQRPFGSHTLFCESEMIDQQQQPP